jgi:hypothetical protein
MIVEPALVFPETELFESLRGYGPSFKSGVIVGFGPGGRFAVDHPLDFEQGVDPLHRGQRHRRDEGGRAALRLALGVLRDIG